MNARRHEIWQICLRNIILNYTVEVGLKPTPSGFRKSCHTLTGALASHADVLRGSSSVPAPLTSADLSGKKRRPITADFKIWEVHFAGP